MSIEARLAELESRVAAISKAKRSLERALLGLLLGGAAVLVSALAPRPAQDVIVARSIVVVDDAGTPRVQIGAPLPDPPILGRRVSRGDVAHGVLIFDATGTERGGYVTFDDSGVAMVSVDNQTRWWAVWRLVRLAAAC